MAQATSLDEKSLLESHPRANSPATIAQCQDPGEKSTTVEAAPTTPLAAGNSPAILMGKDQTGTDLNWTTTGFMVLFHLGAVAALFYFSWTALIVAAVIYILAINVGIGMGYHRLLTHRGYRVPKIVEYFLATCGTLALEGGPISWVSIHRVHHQHSDHAGDPHTPQEGTWWAHVGWIISGRALHFETSLLSRYVPDLSRHRFYLWLSRYHWIPLAILATLLLGIGILFGGFRMSMSMLLWGIFMRTTLGLHATWLVNSATHLQGRRRFETRDDSRNNWWVAILTGGEGWHNNHHAHPVSARHGLAWYEFDPNYYGIWILKKFGIATKVHTAKVTSQSAKSS